ncbi:Aspercryptin biosynthesis cluster-specific transcription regulator atnN [Colletotrichum siamense]|uniref:Aspercryptin biosynthesis cluster-specific transcription regulator atnN n=1 Tax=Colletotrichum siamense TaxID=690259 RepID=UPI00187295A0|nr:Aspercryptin biosynthesis cluster-specific transcription regulator atnN [Colletotrichum siamense]KAF5505435.1 Aspercryptin biosynthesis cluster-specific transcription regulator atnN [Colletotrichum siamense]
MARKGSRKTRTGCITCKIRKVKCDETKPACNRCMATGRHCDGYLPTGSTSARHTNSALRLYRPEGFPGIRTAGESRALQYFCQEAGPQLSGAVDPLFMSKLVMQFTSYEPAARHAVLAISTLTEQLHGGTCGPLVRIQDQEFALHHYNAAINDIRKLRSPETHPVVLLVCILFICIDVLQENRKMVIQHCKHGFALLKHTTFEYAWTKQYLLPLFRRVAATSFIWADDPSDFPDLDGLEHPMPDGFFNFADAQAMIDDVFSRTLRLVRQGDPYRIRPETNGSPPPELLTEQSQIRRLLEQWELLMEDFEARPLSPPGRESPTTENLTKTLRFILRCRFESCKIWLNMALDSEIHDHDKHMDTFVEMLQDLGVTDPGFLDGFRRSPSFMCDAGYVPMIVLTSAKCAHLESRLSALKLVPVPGLPRELLCLPAHAWGCPEVKDLPQVIQTSTEDTGTAPDDVMEMST